MKKELVLKDEMHPFSLKSRLKSFGFAFEGFIAFLNKEPNALIHFIMTLAAFVASVMFHINKTETIAVIFAVAFVWVAELLNTAVERLADMITEEPHPAIKYIKDVSAAAVLISSIAAFLTGAIIFLPKI